MVGMVGGGPVARMTHQAAITLGQSLRVLASPGDGVALATPHVRLGDVTDLAALRRFAADCDVLVVVDERVSPDHLAALRSSGATVAPSAEALLRTQDLTATCRAWALPRGGPVPQRRVVALVARSPFGQVAAYPLVETTWRDGHPVEVLAPARQLDAERAVEAQRQALDFAVRLGVVGLLLVEFVETPGGLEASELSLRGHDAGHWTWEGARTPHLEQYLRAVLDYPLGQTRLTAPAIATVAVLAGAADEKGLDERLHHLYAHDPGVRVHLYGERPSPGNRIGHVTVLGEDADDVRSRAGWAAGWLQGRRDDEAADRRGDGQ